MHILNYEVVNFIVIFIHLGYAQKIVSGHGGSPPPARRTAVDPAWLRTPPVVHAGGQCAYPTDVSIACGGATSCTFGAYLHKKAYLSFKRFG